MSTHAVEPLEEKPVRRFTSYEEFQREFYPKSTAHESKDEREGDGGFGVELAFDSLNRLANELKFGRE